LRTIVIAVLVAAGTGAAQLGLGYGLGVMAWVPAPGAEQVHNPWTSSLAWTAWIAAASVVAGAVCAQRLGGAQIEGGAIARLGWRLVTALSATIGGLITVPLVAVPAHAALLDTNFAHLLPGVYAVCGVVIGLFAALGALTARAIATNVIATAAWLWVLAVVAVVAGVGGGPRLGFAQLGVWKFVDNGMQWRNFYLPTAILTLGAALLIGGFAAWPAAWRGENRIGVTISGAVGPLLVACAYVLAQPIFSDEPIEQVSAFYTAPYAVIAGLAGSLLVATVAGREAPVAATGRARVPVPRPVAAKPAPTAKGTAAVPAQDKPVKATARAQVPMPANGSDAAKPTTDPEPPAKPAVASGAGAKPATSPSADMKTPAAGTATIGRQGKRGRRG
jgi:hypothetical protein